MSISIHLNGKNLKSFGAGVQHHQERFNEKEAEQVSKNSNSIIKKSETKFNQLLYKSDKVKNLSVRKYIAEEFKILNENRVKEGLRRKKKDTNLCAIGTLQISDDSLKKMGYNKSKKWSEQTDLAKENVTLIYNFMTKTVAQNKKIYGELLTATLHVDESTPHVDFIVGAIDSNDYDFTLREIMNGPRGYGTGRKLSEMQDYLADDLLKQTNKKVIYDLALTRGETEKSKKDKLLRLKEFEEELNEREKQMIEQEKQLKDKEIELKKELNEKEKNVIVELCNIFQINKENYEDDDLTTFSTKLVNKIKKNPIKKKSSTLNLLKTFMLPFSVSKSKDFDKKHHQKSKNNDLRRFNKKDNDLHR